MKPYQPKDHIPTGGLLLLVAGSLVLGLAFGGLAYLISNFYYFFVIFPLAIGILAMLAYNKLVQLSKVRQSVIASACAILFGLLIAVGFYGVPYLSFRNEMITGFQEKYHISSAIASTGFDQVLKKVTGSSGFMGYMKLRAISGETYTTYFVYNAVPVQSTSISMNATSLWINWAVETVLFILPSLWIAFRWGRYPFSASANNWYNGPLIQLGSVRLEDKNTLQASLQAGDVRGMCQLVYPEGQINHPQIEFYKQSTRSKQGDSLLSFKQTRRVSERRVSKKMLSQWEVQQNELESVVKILDDKFASIETGSAGE